MDKAMKILMKLKENNFSSYIVGGAVRDGLLGHIPKDIDIATSAKPEEVMSIFPKTYPSGILFGTVTVLIDGKEYEVTTYRKDGDYTDGRRPDKVYFGDSIEEDLSRRDFTINAMAIKTDGEILDLFGGQEDLQKRIIRCVGDPVERFSEDGLRILRAFRFSARYGFEIESKTFEAIKETKENLKNISQERIREEILKILLTDNVTPTFLSMYEAGVLEIILPEIAEMYGVEQNNPYHVYDVFYHTLKVVENTPKDEVLRLAALFHDLGKVYTKETVDGIDRFYGHHKVSKKTTKLILERMKFSNKVKNEILELVYFHDVQVLAKRRSVRRLLNKLEYTNLDNLLALKRADILGQNPKYLARISDLEKIKEIAKSEKKLTVKDLAVNGYDMMELGFFGKEIGKILNYLLDFVIEDPSSNKKEILIEMANSVRPRG